MSGGPKQNDGVRDTQTTDRDGTSDRLAAQADVRDDEGARDAGKRPLHPRVKALIRRYRGRVQFGQKR